MQAGLIIDNAVINNTAAASGSADWFAVQVQPRREKLACLHLERQGFAWFSPSLKRMKARAGRTVAVREALFPGYVFVRLDMARDRWRSINGTIGVSRLVMFGDMPARLPDGFIDGLIARQDEDGVVAFDSAMKPGDQVRIVGGALDDVTGALLTGDGPARVMVLIDLLSGPRRVSVPRERLIAA
ncbi:transcription termination/antitermination NusG family protein [Altererythrobacter sp. GH1-8]|uniref:transcription termination/antitermination NusG family protein n=1 Tax=Altererythrobacter sp. GH1-8 TaxID=3349333 RepID=UPI00374CEA95